MKYSLDISLQFESKADAQSLMDACEPLVTQTSSSSLVSVNNALQEQIKQSIQLSKSMIEDTIAKRQQLKESFQEMNLLVVEMRRQKKVGEEILSNLKDEINKLVIGIEENLVTAEEKLRKNDETISSSLITLKKFNEEVEKAKTCVEATDFLNDMINVHNKVVTGGKVKLMKWEYDRSYGKEHWVNDSEWEV